MLQQKNSVVIDIHPKETRIERGRYYAVKMCFTYRSNFDFEYVYGQQSGNQ